MVSRVKEDVTVKDPRVETEEHGVGDGIGWDISRNTDSNLPG